MILLPGPVGMLLGACRMACLGCQQHHAQAQPHSCPCVAAQQWGQAASSPAQCWWPWRAGLASSRCVQSGQERPEAVDHPPDKDFIFMQLSLCPELCLCLWQKGSYLRSEHCLEPAQGIGFQFQQRLSFPFFSYPSSHHRIIPIPISLPPSPFLSLPL